MSIDELCALEALFASGQASLNLSITDSNKVDALKREVERLRTALNDTEARNKRLESDMNLMYIINWQLLDLCEDHNIDTRVCVSTMRELRRKYPFRLDPEDPTTL